VRTVVYPLLGGLYDLGFVRFSGVGLGNSLFNYFHAVRAAEQVEATILAPSWASLKPRRILTGAGSERFYGGLFIPHVSELVGVKKFALWASGRSAAVATVVDPELDAVVVPGRLNLTRAARFEFGRLHECRPWVRQRLLSISRRASRPNWGRGGFIALHIRLGDFVTASRAVLEAGQGTNLRIPVEWYVAVLHRLRTTYPAMPAVAFSDGSESELTPLLREGVRLSNNSSDLDDLFSMASATILVGANSTFSRWAAFLGDMPTVWFKTAKRAEKPTAKDVPIAYLDFDAAGFLELGL
jgi:Glycosyl transferase family 11